MGHIDSKASPEFFRNSSIKIAIYLSNGIWNAYFPSEALQFIELFIWVADSPPIEIDDAYSSTIHINKVSRMEVSMLIHRSDSTDFVYIVLHIGQGVFVSLKPYA